MNKCQYGLPHQWKQIQESGHIPKDEKIGFIEIKWKCRRCGIETITNKSFEVGSDKDPFIPGYQKRKSYE